MFRALFYLLIFTVAISVIKSVLGIITNAIHPSQNPQQGAGTKGPRSTSTPVKGELRKDPVCGTFVSTSTSLQKKAGGEIYYFCSADCRDKFKG
jgi:YHS domain-containing protein